MEIDLLEYENNNLPVGNHYIRRVQPRTRDLDEVSKQIKALTTRGGELTCESPRAHAGGACFILQLNRS